MHRWQRMYMLTIWCFYMTNATASQQALPKFSPSQLASLARAVAEIGEEPPEAWGGALLQQLQRCANAASAKDVSDMLWACATLGYVPSTACVATLLQQVRSPHKGSLVVVKLLHPAWPQCIHWYA